MTGKQWHYLCNPLKQVHIFSFTKSWAHYKKENYILYHKLLRTKQLNFWGASMQYINNIAYSLITPSVFKLALNKTERKLQTEKLFSISIISTPLQASCSNLKSPRVGYWSLKHCGGFHGIEFISKWQCLCAIKDNCANAAAHGNAFRLFTLSSVSVSTEQIRHTQVTMSQPIGKHISLICTEAQEGNKHAETKDKVITLTTIHVCVRKCCIKINHSWLISLNYFCNTAHFLIFKLEL